MQMEKYMIHKHNKPVIKIGDIEMAIKQQIQIIRSQMNNCLARLKDARQYAKAYHAMKNYKQWARWMHECKQLKIDLEILTYELHYLLYINNNTRVLYPVHTGKQELDAHIDRIGEIQQSGIYDPIEYI